MIINYDIWGYKRNNWGRETIGEEGRISRTYMLIIYGTKSSPINSAT